jgi:GxxExxY protein
MKPNELTREIIGAAIEVHRELGPGKPEAAYEGALTHELSLRRIPHQAQKPVPVVYKGVKLDCGYRLDALVDNTVVVEAKSVELVHPVHRAQGLTYLKLGGWKLALLLNFNVATLKEGIERLVLGFGAAATEPPSTPKRSEVAAALQRPVTSLRSAAGSGDREAELLATKVIAAAMEVHRELGPGLLPSTYETCLCHELHLCGLPFERRRPVRLSYKGTPLAASDEIELLVGKRLVVMPRAVFAIEPVHEAELLSQLRLGQWNLGLLLNFNTIALKQGIRRLVLSRNDGSATS